MIVFFALLWFCLSFFITAAYVLSEDVTKLGDVLSFLLLCILAPAWAVGIIAASFVYGNTQEAITVLKNFFTFKK